MLKTLLAFNNGLVQVGASGDFVIKFGKDEFYKLMAEIEVSNRYYAPEGITAALATKRFLIGGAHGSTIAVEMEEYK